MVRGTPAMKTIEYNGEELTFKERLARIYGDDFVMWLSRILDEVKAPKPGQRQEIVLSKHLE